MSNDETKYLFKIFGRKINKESKGYTEVDYDGIARPVLKIPSDIPKGRRRLTAVYTDERQEINAPSLDRTWLIYGSKCYVHCPFIYVEDTTKEVTVFANLFSNNRPVPGGNSIFKINYKTISPNKLKVVNGYVEQTKETTIKNTTLYQCMYEGSELYKISEGEGEGAIIPYHESKTPYIVEVMKVITNQKDDCTKGKTKLTVRVYNKNHANGYLKYPNDMLKEGTVDFYVDNKKVGSSSVDKNGFATIPITPSQYTVGVHTIVAIYNPSTNLAPLYSSHAGSNTLFVGNDKNKPCITQNGLNCSSKGTNYSFSFNSSRNLNGKVRLYIDGMTINASECSNKEENLEFMGNDRLIYEQEVKNTNHFTFTVKIPDHNTNKAEDSWGYSGNHNMMIQYLEADDELGDMEYWYYWDNFYIQIDTNIYIDNTFVDNTSDNGTFSGNNMYLIDSSNEYVHFKPTTNQIPKSICVGNPLKIYIEDKDSGEKITKGKIKVTITTRKKETWVK